MIEVRDDFLPKDIFEKLKRDIVLQVLELEIKKYTKNKNYI